MRKIKKIRKKCICLLLSVILIGLYVTSSVFANSLSGCSSWARTEVSEAIQEGLVPESIQGDYQKAITRQELAELAAYYLLWHESQGTDLNEMWLQWEERYKTEAASEYIYRENVFFDTNDKILNRMYQFKFIKGFGDGTYRPGQPISRQDAAVIFWGVMEGRTNAYNSDSYYMYLTSQRFKDFDRIGSWAAIPVSHLYVNHCITGITENTFVPDSLITREQAIMITLRMTKNEMVSRI